MTRCFVSVFCCVLVTFQFIPETSAGQQSHAPSAAGYLATCKQACLEDGTPVKLRIAQTVSSADAQVNDRVEFEVLEEIIISDVLIIPKGGIAWGTVTEAVPKRRMARGGKLEIVMDSVRLVDGEKTALRATKTVQGGGHTGGMTAGIVATGLIFWPAAPFFLFMHGKDVSIPKGAEVPTFVNGNLPLDLAKFQQTVPAPALAQGQSNGDTGIEVTSVPSGADVQLDGNFVGNTPSTVGVAPGDHTISLKKNGYKAWDKKIRVTSGKVSISAELEAGDSDQKTETDAPLQTSARSETSSAADSVTLGKIYVISSPSGVDVYLDDSFRGKTPARFDLKPGQHSVRLFAKDYQNWWKPVTIVAGSEVDLTATLVKSN